MFQNQWQKLELSDPWDTQAKKWMIFREDRFPQVKMCFLRRWWRKSKLVTEKDDFENWEKSIMNVFILNCSQYRESDAEINLNAFSAQSSFKNLRDSDQELHGGNQIYSYLEIWARKMRWANINSTFLISGVRCRVQTKRFLSQIILQNFDVFDWKLEGRNRNYSDGERWVKYQVETILKAYFGFFEVFGFFGVSRIWCLDQSDWIVSRVSLYKCEASDWDIQGKNQTCSYGEITFWMSR